MSILLDVLHYDDLRLKLGGSTTGEGTRCDLVNNWLKAQGATTGSTNDKERAFLVGAGMVSKDSLYDMWNAYMLSLGINKGSLADNLRYWCRH